LNRISLKPLDEIDQGVLEELKGKLGEVFDCPVEIEPQTIELAHAYNPSRKQYLSTTLLSAIGASEKGEKALGIVDVDLYAPGLNFVFGEANINSSVAILSLYHLRAGWGLPHTATLFQERVVKEAIHELGHLYFLNHCSNITCVMHFSNSLADTDTKGASFCAKCQQRLGQRPKWRAKGNDR
jgi:archaemetzincin